MLKNLRELQRGVTECFEPISDGDTQVKWPRRDPMLHIAQQRGEGPTVILLHGIASSSVTFQNVLPLVEGRHRCITIDLLGFGGFPLPEDCEYTVCRPCRGYRANHPLAASARTIHAGRPLDGRVDRCPVCGPASAPGGEASAGESADLPRSDGARQSD